MIGGMATVNFIALGVALLLAIPLAIRLRSHRERDR